MTAIPSSALGSTSLIRSSPALNRMSATAVPALGALSSSIENRFSALPLFRNVHG